jgi:hypothetical protein
MLQMAVRSENVQRTTRLELLEVAFAGFSEMMKSYPATGTTKGVSQRNGDGVPVTFCTTNQLIRAMNLCVGLYFAISGFDSALALGRLGSHSCENHFGWLRTILRGQWTWRMWQSAEVAVAMMRRMMVELELNGRAARNRAPEAGVRLSAVADDDAEGKDAAAAFAPTPELLGRLRPFNICPARRRCEDLHPQWRLRP